MSPVLEDVRTLKNAVVGPDMRGGMVADIATMKSDVAEIKKALNGQQKEEQKKGRDWRILGFVILASLASGAIVAVINALIELARSIH
jgi:hypothetical protein